MGSSTEINQASIDVSSKSLRHWFVPGRARTGQVRWVAPLSNCR